jgi:hypothetical protein
VNVWGGDDSGMERNFDDEPAARHAYRSLPLIRCAKEEACVALHEAASFLEDTYNDLVPDLQEFRALWGTVDDWKRAGQELHTAQRRYAAAKST